MKKTLWSILALFSFLSVSSSSIALITSAAKGLTSKAGEAVQNSDVAQSANTTQQYDEPQSDTYAE